MQNIAVFCCVFKFVFDYRWAIGLMNKYGKSRDLMLGEGRGGMAAAFIEIN